MKIIDLTFSVLKPMKTLTFGVTTYPVQYGVCRVFTDEGVKGDYITSGWIDPHLLGNQANIAPIPRDFIERKGVEEDVVHCTQMEKVIKQVKWRGSFKGFLEHLRTDPKFYYERVMTFLREYHPPRVRFHPDSQYTLALGRSIYQLGIRGVERVHYWRLFFWTLFRRPRLFPLAITMTIMGYHFRQVTELHIG